VSVLVIDNPEACGLGEGEMCCAFLTMGGITGRVGPPGAMICGRTVPGIEGVIRERLAAGTMRAKGDPGDVPFPECQRARRGLEPA
jgi:hypothetical protein